MAGIEEYFRNPETGAWEPPGTKLSGMPNAWDQPFDFATPQGGPPARIINTPDSSRGTPFRQTPGVPEISPAQQGRPLTTTPSSTTGAPAPSIRNLPIGGPVGTAVGILANQPTTDEDFYNQVGGASRWFDQTGFGKWLIDQGITSPTPKWGPPTQAEPEARPSNVPPTGESIKLGSGSLPIPITSGGPGQGPSGPVPPGPPTDTPLPPFNRGPIPNDLPGGRVPYPPPRPKDAARGGSGGRGQRGQQQQSRAAPPMVNLQPQPGWTTIDRPNADIAGGPTRPGYLSTDPHTPGGPARMGAFDFSTLFNHPQVAQAAAQHPAVQAAARAPVRAVPARRPVRGPLTPGALGGSGSPTPMDIQDQTRGMYPVTASGTPTPIGAQLGRGRGTPYDPYAVAYPYGA